MKRLQLITALSLISLLSACGGTDSASPNENLYGTWVETQTKGEVVFREDGTVNWKGNEATYELLEETGWGCWRADHPPTTCNRRIAITIDEGWFSDRTFEIGGHGPSSSEPDTWSYQLREFLRKGSFEFPLMPSPFERMPDKLASGSNNEGDEFDPTTISLITRWYSPLKLSANQLIYPASSYRHDYRFDNNRNKWVTLGEFDNSGHLDISPRILTKKTNSDYKTSIDGGITWKSLPFPVPDCYSTCYDAVVGTNIFFAKTIYEEKEVEYSDGTTGVDNVPTQEELWMAETTAENPQWELIDTFNDRLRGHFHPFMDHALVHRSNYSSEYGFINRSYDRGLTWTDFDGSLRAYTGFYKLGFVKRTGSALDWYDVDTRTWTTYTVDFENVLGVSPNRDGVYFKRGNEIHKWSLDGTETLITTLPSEDFKASVVGNHLYVSTIFGLWRMNL